MFYIFVNKKGYIVAPYEITEAAGKPKQSKKAGLEKHAKSFASFFRQ